VKDNIQKKTGADINDFIYISSSLDRAPDFIDDSVLHSADDPGYMKRTGNYFIRPMSLSDAIVSPTTR